VRFRLLRLYGAEGEGDEGSEKGSEEEGSKKEADDEGTKTLTAAELEAMTARSADRASRTATKALAKELGFEKLSDMKKWATEAKEAEAASKSESEQASAQLVEDQATLSASKRAVAQDQLNVKIERAIVRSGVTDDKKLDRLLTLVVADIGDDIDEEDWADAITSAVEGLKTDVPELFAGAKPHGSGDGGAKGDSTDDDDDADAEAKQDKAWADEYTGRGMVPVDLTHLK